MDKKEDFMPQHKSAKKRIRQNERRRLRNVAKRSKLKTSIKKIENATDKKAAEAEFKKTVRRNFAICIHDRSY